MNKIKKSIDDEHLWTKDFTIITVGTLISAIGGSAMSLAMSLVVLDETASTWLAGIFSAISVIPGVVIPVLAAPLIDRCSRKQVIVSMDFLNSILYALFYIYIIRYGFSYEVYLIFQLMTGCAGGFYDLAYDALYPNLIPIGCTQKGYAVSGTIYPTVTAIITPCTAVIYASVGLSPIILGEAVMLAVAAVFETQITVSGQHEYSEKNKRKNGWKTQVKAYASEISEGFEYMKEERGVRKLYFYMAVTGADAQGINLMIRAHFQSTSGLTTTMYSVLTSAEMVGRMIGGFVHYVIRIPEDQKYRVARSIYILYELGDGLMLFMTYPLMLAVRFMIGFLGTNSAALREAAISRYLPDHMRARLNSVSQMLCQIAMILMNVVAGALGEVIAYRYVALVFAVISGFFIVFWIIRNRKDIEKIFKASVTQARK